MHENQDVNIVSMDNIKPLIQLCLQTERDRGLSKNSIVELKRYLNGTACGTGLRGRACGTRACGTGLRDVP